MREKQQFEFKSFYLELFVVNELNIDEKSELSLLDKTVIFAHHWDKIGCVQEDPANPHGNDISTIHSQDEFRAISLKIKHLYDVLIMENFAEIKKIFTGQQKLVNSYTKYDGFEKTPFFKIESEFLDPNSKTWKNFGDNDFLPKNTKLRFWVYVPGTFKGSWVEWYIKNNGIEAANQNALRGLPFVISSRADGNKIFKDEETRYTGSHYIFAKINSHNGDKKTNIRWVRIK